MNTYTRGTFFGKFVIILISGFFSLIPCARVVHATGGETVVISEIMYDLPGSDTSGNASREWIEVKNTGTASVDMTGWKVFDGSNHVLNLPSPENGGQGSLVLEPGAFAVIASNALQFSLDNSTYTGTLIDSVLSLNNEGDTIKICSGTCSATTLVDEVTYTSSLGANGDGNSLQLFQSGWIAGHPTPGADFVHVSNSSSSSGAGSAYPPPVTTPTYLDSKKEPVWTDELTLSMPTIFAHVPFTVTPLITSPRLETHAAGRFVYTVGDGRVIDVLTSEPVEIEYEDPGSYVLYFEFYQSREDKKPTLSDRILLSVEDAPIILRHDDESKVTLVNLHSKDISIAGWKITDGVLSFVFPSHTFLPGKQEMVLNKKIFQTSVKTILLLTPTGHVATTFPSSVRMITRDSSVIPSIFSPFPVHDFTEEISVPIRMPKNTDTSPGAVLDSDTTNIHTNVSSVSSSPWTILFVLFAFVVGILLLVFFRGPHHQEEKHNRVPEEARKYTIEEI